MHTNYFRAVLAALTLVVLLTACESSTSSMDDSGKSSIQAGSFTAQVSGALNSRLTGHAMSRAGGWQGSAFLSAAGCDEEWDDDDKDEWEDGFLEDCDDDGDEAEAKFLSMELIPDGANPDDPAEVVFLGIEGTLAPGTYPISGYDFGDDDSDGTSDADSLHAWGDYFRLTADQMVEEYTGTSGSVTISSMSDSTISGTFAFSSEKCLCLTKDQFEQFEGAIEAIFEAFQESDFEGEGSEQVWDEIEAQFEMLMAQYVVDKAISVDGSFLDVPLMGEKWDDDWDDDDKDDDDDDDGDDDDSDDDDDDDDDDSDDDDDGDGDDG